MFWRSPVLGHQLANGKVLQPVRPPEAKIKSGKCAEERRAETFHCAKVLVLIARRSKKKIQSCVSRDFFLPVTGRTN